MFKKIKNLFSNKKSTTHKTMNIVSVILTDNNDPYIHISIEDTRPESAIQLAKTLYDLNGGLYSDAIINILLSIGKESNTSKLFITQVMMHWSEGLKRSNDLQEPLVKPTDFLKKDST